MFRMAPDDAQALWLASKTHSDQFLLFAFDAVVDAEQVSMVLYDRAGRINELNYVVRETFASLDYPYWVAAPATPEQFRVVEGSARWQECLTDVGARIADQLDPSRAAWRVHLYPEVADLPAGVARGSVAVLQISHALADGRVATRLARDLFGSASLPTAAHRKSAPGPLRAAIGGLLRMPIQLGGIIVRGRAAYRLSRTDPPGPAPVAASLLNRSPGTDRQVRVIVVDAEKLRVGAQSITVGAILAISTALAAAQLVDAADRLVVELTVGRAASSMAQNNFHTAAIDTHRDTVDSTERAAAIAGEIAAARDRDEAPGRMAAHHAAASTPAVLMRWGAKAFDPTARSATVTGQTVVSSVNRGAADLMLGAARVVFTTGFPALSSMQGVTHGVHGIGTAVAFSVTTSGAVLPDVDAYVEQLRRAIDGVRKDNVRKDYS